MTFPFIYINGIKYLEIPFLRKLFPAMSSLQSCRRNIINIIWDEKGLKDRVTMKQRCWKVLILSGLKYFDAKVSPLQPDRALFSGILAKKLMTKSVGQCVGTSGQWLEIEFYLKNRVRSCVLKHVRWLQEHRKKIRWGIVDQSPPAEWNCRAVRQLIMRHHLIGQHRL